MKSWIKDFTRGLFVAGVTLFLCSSCDRAPLGTGEAEFQITDAPSDDPEIAGVFVTVADLKVAGNSISGFSRQTINLKDFQEGKTQILGTTQLDAKTFDNVVLVLDVDKDAVGGEPGCYVLTRDGQKIKLGSNGTINIPVNKTWNVYGGSKTKMVLDFDIRKSILQLDGLGYGFIAGDRLSEALRMVDQDHAGNIVGTYADPVLTTDKIIVYAYLPGTYFEEIETQPQGAGGLRFLKSVSSAEIKAGVSSRIFTLAFLEEGKYELHFAAYRPDATTSRLQFLGLLDDQTAATDTPSTFVKVEKGTTTNTNTIILHNHFNHQLPPQ